MATREKAWKCWLEIVKTMKKAECYMKKGDSLCISKGCSGQFVDIIQKYL